MAGSAAIQGLRGTGEFDVDFRPKNYRELFTLLEPNGNAPLNALLAMASSEATDDPEYKNFRDELPDRVLQTDTTYDAVTTAINLYASDQNKFAIAGSVVVNSATGEVMHVSADVTAGTMNVVRNVGGTAFTITADDFFFIAGHAAKEGSDTPTPITFDASVAFNYTQIFRTAFSVTGTLNQTFLRTGNKLDEAMMKALKLHMSDIERAMFWGNKDEIDGNTSEPTRFTGGITNEITTVLDVGAHTTPNVYTEDEFDLWLIETVFKYGSKEKLVFCGAKVANNLMKMGKDRWQPIQVQGTYGVRFTRYQTFAGDLLVHLHPQFRQVPAADSSAVLIDFPYLLYRYLQSRDTHLLENRQGPGEDRIKHEYLTECGLELLQDQVHSYMTGWEQIA